MSLFEMLFGRYFFAKCPDTIALVIMTEAALITEREKRIIITPTDKMTQTVTITIMATSTTSAKFVATARLATLRTHDIVRPVVRHSVYAK
ncbi:MAG: hypothetical protein ACRC5A_16410 [Enterobacteriaceae bacterium]